MPHAAQPYICRLSDLPAEPIDWLWPGYLAAGKLALIDGDPNQGKSLLALDLAARLSTGRALPDGYLPPGPQTVALLGGEDGTRDTVIPRLRAAGADLSRDHILGIEPMDGSLPHAPCLPDDCGLLRDMLRATAARLLIADPLFAFLSRKSSPLNDAAIRRALTPLARVAEDTRSAGYANVRLLVIDEAARVPDHLHRTVRPMLAVSGGRIVLLSTPCGKRGFFYDTWTNGGDTWKRIEVPATQIPRIAPDFLEEERRTLGESWFRQEYCCSFEALEGLVYPNFARCVVPSPSVPVPLPLPVPLPQAANGQGQGQGKMQEGPLIPGRHVGGIDFGFHNPFAAVWGVLDRDGILWLTGEHYQRQRPLSYHAEHLPRGVRWYADPSGASDIEELVCAGFAVSRGINDIRTGIAAVTARLETDRLRVVAGACPNLLREASLYRYSDDSTDRRSETPVDEHNHALSALRYLVSMIDARQMARMKGKGGAGDSAAEVAAKEKKREKKWLSYRNEALWTRIV